MDNKEVSNTFCIWIALLLLLLLFFFSIIIITPNCIYI